MKIEIKGKNIELGYTFNSFRYMEDFDISEFNELEKKPFKMAIIAEDLLLGAVNQTPLCKFTREDVVSFLDEYVKTESIVDLTETLMSELEKSDFFTSLQKTQAKQSKKK